MERIAAIARHVCPTAVAAQSRELHGTDGTVVAVSTVRCRRFPSLCWVLVQTSDGIVGLGETTIQPAAVEARVHETIAPYLLGQPALAVSRHARALRPMLGAGSSGVETRANAAVDIALWDAWGKGTNQPIYQLLGGAWRDSCQVYATCLGGEKRSDGHDVAQSPGYGHTVRMETVVPNAAPTGPPIPAADWPSPYSSDGARSWSQPVELAKELLAEGITMMKIQMGPKIAAHKNRAPGRRDASPALTEAAMEEFVAPIAAIRKSLGSAMEVAVDWHHQLDVASGIRLAKKLEPYSPRWIEDAVTFDSLQPVAQLASATSIPLCVSETMGGSAARFADVVSRTTCRHIMYDLGWLGGISVAREVAVVADAAELPTSTHSQGPVQFAASAHLAVHCPGCELVEMVRASYYGYFQVCVAGSLSQFLTKLIHVLVRAKGCPGATAASRGWFRESIARPWARDEAP